MGHRRILVQKICQRILPSQRLGGVTSVLSKDVSVFGLVLPLVHDILWLLLSAGPMVVMSARGRANGESRMVVSCFLHLLCHMLNDRFLIVIPCGDSFNVLAYHDFWCDFLHIWQWRGSPRWNGSGAPDLSDKFPIKTSEQSSLATSPPKSSSGSFWTCVLPKVAQQITSGSTFLDVHAIYSSSSRKVSFAQLWWLLLRAFSFIVQDIVWRRALCNWGLSFKKSFEWTGTI